MSCSFCTIYAGEWFPSALSQSQVRPILDQKPDHRVEVNFALSNMKWKITNKIMLAHFIPVNALKDGAVGVRLT